MFTSAIWKDDSKLLHGSNLTARQPCRAPITLYISFKKCRHLVKEGLVNLLGIPSLHPLGDVNSVCQHQRTRCFPLLFTALHIVLTIGYACLSLWTFSSFLYSPGVVTYLWLAFGVSLADAFCMSTGKIKVTN